MSSIEIKNFGEKYSFRISTEQVNQYYHTLLGNPFERLKYLNFETKIYEFYRTPGIIEYFIRYYLHQGCLTNDIHIPVEILYDEFRFFGFNEQISYEILSSLITIEYYIPSGLIFDLSGKKSSMFVLFLLSRKISTGLLVSI